MNKKLTYAIAFTLGAAVGTGVTWKVLKTKYDKLIKEEIESVKESYKKKANEEFEYDLEVEEELDEVVEEIIREAEANPFKECEAYIGDDDEALKDCEVIIKEEGYSDDDAYLIEYDEFAELDGYNTMSLNYYADGILTDEYDNLIEDKDELIGEDNLDKFDAYEVQTIFVRNDAKRCDYEIVRDMRRYSDIQFTL